jgi:Filamentous haemagglutinin family outer membrane protein
MTTFGGNIVAWSATGDINAGRGSKTTVVYTPPRRVYDNYGNITLSPTVPSSGAGIATLNPIPQVAAGNINLVAPHTHPCCAGVAFSDPQSAGNRKMPNKARSRPRVEKAVHL